MLTTILNSVRSRALADADLAEEESGVEPNLTASEKSPQHPYIYKANFAFRKDAHDSADPDK